MSSTSLGCNTSSSTFTPGRLPFLRSPRVLSFITRPFKLRSSRISTTSMHRLPSAKSSLFPGWTDWHSLAYEHPIFVSSSVLYPSNVVYSSGPAAYTMISWSFSSWMGSWSFSIAVLTSGPLVSRSTAQLDFFSAQTLRKRSSTPWWASWSPCEKLKRATDIPSSISSLMVCSSQHLGPMVHTILVFRVIG